MLQYEHYISVHEKIEKKCVRKYFDEKPDGITGCVKGVRYSIEIHARTESNIVGTFELLEAARAYPPKHTLIASTSSAYGSNIEMPHRETDKADNQMSFYAATKKCTESMATVIHTYMSYP